MYITLLYMYKYMNYFIISTYRQLVHFPQSFSLRQALHSRHLLCLLSNLMGEWSSLRGGSLLGVWLERWTLFDEEREMNGRESRESVSIGRPFSNGAPSSLFCPAFSISSIVEPSKPQSFKKVINNNYYYNNNKIKEITICMYMFTHM